MAKHRRYRRTLTSEQEAIIRAEYAQCVDSAALAERLGMSVKDLRDMAYRLGIKKDKSTRSQICTNSRFM